MKILAVNIFLLIFALTVYAVGYEYDRTNALYPELVFLSYDLAIETYGERWSRAARFVLLTILIFDFTAVLIWYRSRRGKQAARQKTFVE